MALNPLRPQVLPAEEQREAMPDRSGSFPMYPLGHEEFSRLQELLAQALKREAEAHRKMKHLHEQLMERNRSLSDGEREIGTLCVTPLACLCRVPVCYP
jgi:hypothetical protein